MLETRLMRSLNVLLITLFFSATVAAHDLEADAEVAYLTPSAPTVPIIPAPTAPIVPAAPPVPAPVPGTIPLKIEEPIDPAEVAYDLTMSWLKPDEWKAKVKS